MYRFNSFRTIKNPLKRNIAVFKLRKKNPLDSCSDCIAASPAAPPRSHILTEKVKNINQSRWGDETFSLIIWEFINESAGPENQNVKEIKIRPRPRSSKVCSGVNEKRSQTGYPGDLRLNETEDRVRIER